MILFLIGRFYAYYKTNPYEIYEYKGLMTKKDTVQEWEKEQIEEMYGINTNSHIKNYTLKDNLIDWYLSYKRK